MLHRKGILFYFEGNIKKNKFLSANIGIFYCGVFQISNCMILGLNFLMYCINPLTALMLFTDSV